MKKVFILLSLVCLNLFLIFLSNRNLSSPQVLAAQPIIKPLGVDLSAQGEPYPAPPLGERCGKTMCLKGEVCVRYPQEEDEHCVPEPLEEPAGFPPSCWDSFGKGEGSFPPNSDCFNHFKSTQKDLSLYEKTCIYQPIVEYTSDREVKRDPAYKNQDFIYCGKGDAGGGSNPPEPPGSIPFECTVSMLVYTDVRDATLGSYGPDQQTRDEKSSDFIAQNYLYSALFERPDNLSNENNASKNREAYRTYWRLLPAYNQINLRSFILNLANEDLIDNIHFDFTNTKGVKSNTDFKSLYNNLSKQVILFWHWPFIRQGCLTDYPVCPEYAQAAKELEPLAWSLTDSISKNPAANAILGTALDAYHQISTLLGADIADAYSAFTPLDFNSLRGYIVKKKDGFEEEMYRKQPFYDPLLQDEKNAPRYSTGKKPNLTNVSRESLPYIGAIYQGLLSPKFGLLPALQPQWITEKYTGRDGLSDYRLGNIASESAEAVLDRQGLLSRIESEVPSLLTNPFGWLKEKIASLFTKEVLQKKGYTEPEKDNTNEEVKGQYVNFKGCPLPVSYHLISPKTAAGSIADPTYESYDDHHQVISIDGDALQWTYTPTTRPLREYKCIGDPTDPKAACSWDWIEIPCADDIYEYPEGDSCVIRHWKVYGTKHGKALTVLNNPKQTDIKNAIIQNDKYSFYNMMIPDTNKKITDASVDAPIAYNFNSRLNSGATATAPNGDSKIFNPAESINRINNRAQDSMHLLQNCWTVPDQLQNSPRCELVLPEPSPAKDACKGEAFAKIETNPQSPSGKAQAFWGEIEGKLTSNSELIEAYSEAEKQTGVPCEVLAGIHFEEADLDPTKDLQSGGDLAGRTLTESAVQAATELLGKAGGGSIDSLDTLIKSLSWYNGGGNSNCQAGGSNNCPAAVGKNVCGVTLGCSDSNPTACVCSGQHPEPGSCRSQCVTGFPFQFNYNFCPPQTTGYDDPYVTNWWKSPEHDNMYLLYLYDCTPTRPQIHNRPGSLTVAIMYYLSHKK